MLNTLGDISAAPLCSLDSPSCCPLSPAGVHIVGCRPRLQRHRYSSPILTLTFNTGPLMDPIWPLKPTYSFEVKCDTTKNKQTKDLRCMKAGKY